MGCAVDMRQEGGGQIVTLTGDAVVAAASELARTFLDVLVPGRDARIDLSALERLDSAGIQVLLCAHGWFERHGATLTVAAGDGAALRALRLSGALPHLHFTEVGPQPSDARSGRSS